MKCAIYQFWEGNITSGNKAGVELMKEYANRIGAEHIFELNPSWPNVKIKRQNLGRYNPHYGAFKPIFDTAYDDYDYILFCDADVVPRNTRQNIFDEFAQMANIELGICEEWMQPEFRQKYNIGGINSANDNKWHDLIRVIYGHDMVKDDKGRHRVFNSGCVMYSAAGRVKAQNVFVDFKEYVSLMQRGGLPAFYQGDQNYLNAMIPHFNWGIMDYKWNSQIFFQPGTTGDNRPIADYTENANFVHVQLRGADSYDMNKLKEVIKYD
jgi:hypothetical protein